MGWGVGVYPGVGSSCGRFGSGLWGEGRCWVEWGWVGWFPCRVVVGWGWASGGRVGVGSNGVGSGRLRVELWSGGVGPLGGGLVLGRMGSGRVVSVSSCGRVGSPC